MNELNLKNKVAVVTGGAGVICSTMAKSLAAEGVKTVILDLNKDAADKIAAEIEKDHRVAVADRAQGLPVPLDDERGEKLVGHRGIALPDGPAHLVDPDAGQVCRIHRWAPGEQFVEQHAERVDVAARIDIEAAQLRLLGAHVGRRADELFERGEQRFVC